MLRFLLERAPDAILGTRGELGRITLEALAIGDVACDLFSCFLWPFRGTLSRQAARSQVFLGLTFVSHHRGIEGYLARELVRGHLGVVM